MKPGTEWSRREILAALMAAGTGSLVSRTSALAATPPPLRIATFRADITVPLGHGMMGGAWLSKSVLDPLEAHGFVLTQGDMRVVWVSLDWCELRNDAYARWQTVLAKAAGTFPDRVLLTTVHQHDAPVADLEAERLLKQRGLAATICDPEFHERAVQRVASALKSAMKESREITEIGTGESRVQRVASNRRYPMPDGSIRFDRMSSTRNAFAIAADEGLVDPMLKTVSFWSHGEAVAAVSFYAVHPMSFYGKGEISADFPGIARRLRESDTPKIHQIYCSGCSGNVTAGKYNDGSPANRPVLAERLRTAMVEAWARTKRQPVERMEFRTVPLFLKPRSQPGFSVADLERKLATQAPPFQQCLAALALSWRKRCDAKIPIRIPCIDLGSAQLLLLPGEAYVEYQLSAQRMRPSNFVCVAGYGDGGTGYIPTEKHIEEHDPNLNDWCWVDPGCEAALTAAVRRALTGTLVP